MGFGRGRVPSMCHVGLLAAMLVTVWGGGRVPAAELRPGVDLPVVEVQRDAEGRVGFGGAGRRIGETGEPDLPWHGVTVLVPPGVDSGAVSAAIQDATYETIEGACLVDPIPPAATYADGRLVVDEPADRVLVEGRDVRIYTRDAVWPRETARVLGVPELRGWRLVEVAIPLARYNPARQQLERLVDGTLVIGYEVAEADGDGETSFRADDAFARERLAELAVNFDHAAEAYTAGAEPEADGEGDGDKPGYVIFVTSDLLGQLTRLDAFVAVKEARGFDVQIVTDTDLGGASGDVAAESIRGWLQAHYLADNIHYVLIIADPHPSTSTLPMKMLWPRRNSSDHHEAPSDYYYADLTGNWDLDGDGFAGERYDDFGTGGVDRHAEVLVGRLPHYATAVELDAVLDKFIRFERTATPDAAWRRKVLLPMEPSDGSTPGYHLGEEIKDDIVVPTGWGYHRVYDEDYGLTPPPETTPCTKPNVSAAWNASPFGLVVWWTHGSYYSATDIMDSLWATKTDANYPVFTFQVSCHNSKPEQLNLTATLLGYGAAAGIGATRVSWYYPGQTVFVNSPSNSGMGYAYANKIVALNRTCGEALHEIKEDLYPSSSAMWMNFCVFNIYGDPSLSLVPKRFALQVAVTNEAFGEVTLSPPAEDANLAVYEAGQAVTLNAAPTGGNRFEAWALCDPNYPGDLNHAVHDSNNPITVVMDRDREIHAIFRCSEGLPGSFTLFGMGLMGLLGWRRRAARLR